MAAEAPPRVVPEARSAPGAAELLFPEARRRRRRRWMVGIGLVGLVGSAATLGLRFSGGGHGAPPGSPEPFPGALITPAGSSAGLQGGRWTTLPPPHPGVVKRWDLAAWTGRYVIAWGSTATTTGPGGQSVGRSEHGAAFDPATRSWRSLPPAPVDIKVESTIWTGHEILVWGSAAAGRSGRNVLLALNPATWRWRRLTAPPMALRTGAKVLWSGTRLIIIGGHRSSVPALLTGASYDLRANRWSELPAVPHVFYGAGTKEEPVGVTAAWAAGALYVWVTRQVSQSCGANCMAVSAKVQPLRWSPVTLRWDPGPTPPAGVPAYRASALSMGKAIALLGGSSCLPEMSCPGRISGHPELVALNTDTETWIAMPASAVLSNATSFAWTGRSLIAVSPYLSGNGHLLGGYAAAFDPASGSWANLPALPVPTSPPSGPVLTGTVWAGSELIDSHLSLIPGHRHSATGVSTASALPSCPPIAFPEWVGGYFCGPAPGPGNGYGLDGSCIGTEQAPPCGPGMVPDKSYPYTLIGSCTNYYIDGRWWRNQLPGGSGPVKVWISVNTTGTSARLMGPNGAVGFEPSATSSCS